MTTEALICPACGHDAVPVIYGTPAPGTSRPQQVGLLRYGGMYTADAPNARCTGDCTDPAFTIPGEQHSRAVAAAIAAVS